MTEQSNDYQTILANAADTAIKAEDKGANAISAVVAEIERYIGIRVQEGAIPAPHVWAKLAAEAKSEAFGSVCNDVFIAADVNNAKDDSPRTKDIKRRRKAMLSRAVKLYAACHVLAQRVHDMMGLDVLPNYKEGKYPALWFIPTDSKTGEAKYSLVKETQLIPFKATKGHSVVICEPISGEGDPEAVNFKANEAAVWRAAFGSHGKAKGKDDTNKNEAGEVNDKTAKDAASVLDSYLAGHAGNVKDADASDSFANICAHIAHNDHWFGVVMEERRKYEAEKAAAANKAA